MSSGSRFDNLANWRLTGSGTCANLLTVSQTNHIGCAAAAQILGCSTAKVKRLAKSGQLVAAFKMDGQTGAYVFARSTVLDYAERHAGQVAA